MRKFISLALALMVVATQVIGAYAIQKSNSFELAETVVGRERMKNVWKIAGKKSEDQIQMVYKEDLSIDMIKESAFKPLFIYENS